MTPGCRRALIIWPLDGSLPSNGDHRPCRATFCSGHASALIAASVVALVIGCDRESPTDVAAPAVQASAPAAPAFAVSAGMPSNSSYEIKSAGLDVASGNLGVVEVLCSAGKRALGGGHKIGGGALIDGPAVALYESTPRVTGGTDGWRVEAMNCTADTRRIEAWVVCAAT
jgi:hypothetical protein